MRVQSDDKNFDWIIYQLFGPYACFQIQRHLRVDQIQTGDNDVKRLGDRLGLVLAFGAAWRNLVNCLREIASAIILDLVEMYSARNKML